MTALIIILAIWIIGIPVAYFWKIQKWEGKSLGEKIYFSAIWPLTAILYGIHYIHNNNL